MMVAEKRERVMELSHGKKAAAQVALLVAGSRHAVLRRMARRGGDGAEQSNQIMSGVCGHWVRKFSGVSQTHVPLPGLDTGGGDALLTNLHLPNFLKGGLYQGAGKTVCVPGLNCYSCPAASGACPIGAFQAVVGSSKFSFSYYITGFLILLGVLLGRFICGFLCPFGWFQELLHKIPTKKLSTKKLKPLTYLKYVVLLVMVFLLPAFLVNDVGMGDPFFCKYLCPQGVLEGAIPLSLANSGIRAALGEPVYMEILYPAGGDRAERGILPSLLQVALPAGRVLRAVQPGVPLSDEGGQKQVRILRKMCQSLQNGCGRDEGAQSYRMHPLRDVHTRLPDGGRELPLRLWRR